MPSYPPSHRRLFSRRAVTISVCRAREDRVCFALAVVFAPRSNHFVRASCDQIRTQQRTSLFRQTACSSADFAQKQRSFKIVPSVVIRNIHIKFHNAHFLFPAPSCPNRAFFSLKKTTAAPVDSETAAFFPFKCRIVRKARDSFQDRPRFFENTESASLCLSSAINDLPILRRFVKSFHARGSASPADRPSASSPGTNASPRRRRIFKNKSRFFKKSFCYVDAVPFFVQKKSLRKQTLCKITIKDPTGRVRCGRAFAPKDTSQGRSSARSAASSC